MLVTVMVAVVMTAKIFSQPSVSGTACQVRPTNHCRSLAQLLEFTMGPTGVPTCLSRGGAGDGRFSSASPPASGIRCAASSPQRSADTGTRCTGSGRNTTGTRSKIIYTSVTWLPPLTYHLARSPKAEPPSRLRSVVSPPSASRTQLITARGRFPSHWCSWYQYNQRRASLVFANW